MAVNNNTTRLGTGFRVTARQFDGSPSASMISGEIARANYRALSKTDPKLAKLRQYVRKLVSTFPQADKMAILSEFGDPRRGTSDEAVVEALITNLKESELDVLVRDVMIDENNLSKKVRKIKADKKRAASKFTTKTFEDVYSAVKTARNPRQMRRALEAYDKSFRIPRAVVSQFGGLKREVESVLNDVFNVIELTGIALKMGIMFEDETPKKQLVGLITNKVLLFVSLVTGRSKATYSAAIIDETPYKEVLQYTTYAWAAGVSGMTQDGLKTLRQQARQAKAKQKEAFIQKERPTRRLDSTGFERFLNTINPLAAVGRFGRGIAGAAGRGIGGFLDRSGIAGGLGGFFGGASGLIEQIVSLGQRGGRAEGARQGRAGAIAGARGLGEFLGGPNAGARMLETEAMASVRQKQLAAGTAGIQDYLTTMSGPQLMDEARKYGIRTFPLRNANDENRLRTAIRVKIAQLEIRKKRLETKASELARRGRSLSEQDKGTLEALGSQIKSIEAGKGIDYIGSDKIPYVEFNQASGVDITKVKVAVPVFVVNTHPMGGSAPTSPVAAIANAIAPAPTAGAQAPATGTAPAPIPGAPAPTAATALRTVYGGPAANAADLMSPEADSVKLSKRIKKEPVTPVYVVNKSVPTDTGKLLVGVLKAILNFVPFGGAIGSQIEAMAKGTPDIASMLGLATGGTGRASGLARKTTHFISGDSLSKRPNPEQVSINWSDKSYSVKPIPQFAEGGGQTASGQVRRMTPGERQEPMKVYAVNNSITEMVDVNGQSVSLIGLVSEMNGRLGTIEGLLAIGNRNSEAIVKSTSLTATGVGRLSSSQNASGSINPFAGGGFPSDLNPILSGV